MAGLTPFPFGNYVESNMVAKYTVETLDFAAGPIIYGVKKIPAVENLIGQATGAVNGYFGDGFERAGYTGDAVQKGGVGGSAVLSVGFGGFAGMIKKAGGITSIFKSRGGDLSVAGSIEKTAGKVDSISEKLDVFENLKQNDLKLELSEAKKLGVSPTKVTDPSFAAIANEGPIKWAVLEGGDLVVIPKFVDGVELKHTVLSGDKPVLAAGEALIDVFDNGKGGVRNFGSEINRKSGHFQPSLETLNIGVKGFGDIGIDFKTVKPKITKDYIGVGYGY